MNNTCSSIRGRAAEKFCPWDCPWRQAQPVDERCVRLTAVIERAKAHWEAQSLPDPGALEPRHAETFRLVPLAHIGSDTDGRTIPKPGSP